MNHYRFGPTHGRCAPKAIHYHTFAQEINQYQHYVKGVWNFDMKFIGNNLILREDIWIKYKLDGHLSTSDADVPWARMTSCTAAIDVLTAPLRERSKSLIFDINPDMGYFAAPYGKISGLAKIQTLTYGTMEPGSILALLALSP
ncbi:hypothetical protein McaMca56_003356 [Microsporum canis]